MESSSDDEDYLLFIRDSRAAAPPDEQPEPLEEPVGAPEDLDQQACQDQQACL
jgi:hypothetical protein